MIFLILMPGILFGMVIKTFKQDMDSDTIITFNGKYSPGEPGQQG